MASIALASTWIPYYFIQTYSSSLQNIHNSWQSSLILTLALIFLIPCMTILTCKSLRKKPIYLVDFVCFKPSINSRVSSSAFVEHSILTGFFNQQSLKFQQTILERSGLGELTSLPFAMQYLPPRPSLQNARDEAELVIFSTLEKLFNIPDSTPNLAKLLTREAPTRFDTFIVGPQDVDILIVNCSLFSPSPSLCSLIINKFKMRSDVKSYNLSGMGCSASIISLSLAQKLLLVHPNSCALIISTENITQNWYLGNRRSMVIPNCLFRMGGVAILLSNKASHATLSKYQLSHVVRTITGGSSHDHVKSYKCVFQEQDEDGNYGVTLSKDLTKVAGEALRQNITSLAPLVLPFFDQFVYIINETRRRLTKRISGSGTSDARVVMANARVPNFRKTIKHFCIHAGGRAIIDELEKSLGLSPQEVEPSRMTLYRFGNTSSSSIWYELAYLEGKGRIMDWDRVWQIAFGSGFKCNSAVWIAIGANQGPSRQQHNAWLDCIHEYPVEVPSFDIQ